MGEGVQPLRWRWPVDGEVLPWGRGGGRPKRREREVGVLLWGGRCVLDVVLKGTSISAFITDFISRC